MVVGNRGGKEQIVAALLYIFPVGIAVTVSESDREKKKKKKRRKKKVKRKSMVVLFRLSRESRLTLAPFFPFRMFNYQGVKSNAISFRREFSLPFSRSAGGKR